MSVFSRNDLRVLLNAHDVEEHGQQLVQLAELQHMAQLLHLRSPVQHRSRGRKSPCTSRVQSMARASPSWPCLHFAEPGQRIAKVNHALQRKGVACALSEHVPAESFQDPSTGCHNRARF